LPLKLNILVAIAVAVAVCLLFEQRSALPISVAPTTPVDEPSAPGETP
jgi:hypothetical protein